MANKRGTMNPPNMDKRIWQPIGENILMFCAANDEGLDVRYDQTYPAACKNMVICIGAAKPSGKTDANVGEQNVDFTIPGQVVLDQPRSGSSVSTALAAGLAGLILFCVSISSHNKYATVIRQRNNMERVLRYLARSSTDSRATLIRVKEAFISEFASWDWKLKGKDELDKLVGRLLMYVKDDENSGRLRRVITGNMA
ncbi:hypothetical protein K440DRAFT_67976 [Wilcoxina mikolae CBS 423.85]|nr:hypothetical protein K440DRAFT_67976 [Wilcoxina mikolae CBS 423.85]